MRVGLDISNAIDPRPSGVARYIRQLWAALHSLPEPPEIKLYCRPSRLRRGRPAHGFPGSKIHWLMDSFSPRGVDVFHAPDLRMPRRVRCPLAVTIHDLSSLRRSDHASPTFVETKRQGYREAADRAAVLITQTRAVRNEIHQELGVPEAKIVAIPLADPLPTSNGSLPPHRAEDRLLVVGGPSVRKGSARIAPLLAAWAEQGWRPQVTWVGSTPAEEANHFLAQLPGETRDAIEFLGHVTDEELADLYARATGLLQLSDAEGFGIPLLEAAQRGCAVISLDSAPLRETLGDAAFWLREPASEAGELCLRFRNLEERHRVVEQARALAKNYSWRRTAEETLAAYRLAAR